MWLRYPSTSLQNGLRFIANGHVPLSHLVFPTLPNLDQGTVKLIAPCDKVCDENDIKLSEVCLPSTFCVMSSPFFQDAVAKYYRIILRVRRALRIWFILGILSHSPLRINLNKNEHIGKNRLCVWCGFFSRHRYFLI